MYTHSRPLNIGHKNTQWRFYIGARGAKPLNSEKEGFSPPNSKAGRLHIFFAGVVG